jgi:beta-mannanase
MGRVNPWISMASEPSQYYDTALAYGAEAALQMKLDGFWYATTINDTWKPAYMNPIRQRPWVAYATFSYANYPNVLQAVIAGTFDAAITAMARASIGYPMLVRYFHEMNIAGTGSTWFNDPTHYIPAWQHIHSLWRAAGNNSPFLWSPNITWQNGATPIGQYYPGDNFVDLVGLDGYRSPLRAQDSFKTLFEPDVATLKSLTTKPIVIAEVGADAWTSGRAAWIAEMFDYLIGEPRVIGLNWWWRDQYTLAGDSLSIGAFVSGVRAWRQKGVAAVL